MELWAMLVGASILRGQKALIFGRDTNPINFVSVEDVAYLAVAALEDPPVGEPVLEIGGPQNLTLMAVARLIE